MNRTVLLPDFQNVVATGTAICTLTQEVTGKVLEGIMLKLGGTTFTRAMITGWRLKADGRPLRTSTGADTNSIYTYYGRANTATEMFIDFMMPQARTPLAYASGALDCAIDTSKITNLTLEVDIAGATAPTLKGWAELSPSVDIPQERPVRWLMLREERAQIVVGASGETDIAQYIPHFLPSGGGGVYTAIHLFAANVTDIRVKRNGVEEFKYPVAVMQALQKRAGRVPQANHVVFDPMTDNMLEGRTFSTSKAMGVEKANFFVTMSGAETFWVQTQQLALLTDF